MDAHSHILNELERTCLLGSQVCFEELDLGLKKLHKGGESYKLDALFLVFNEYDKDIKYTWNLFHV